MFKDKSTNVIINAVIDLMHSPHNSLETVRLSFRFLLVNPPRGVDCGIKCLKLSCEIHSTSLIDKILDVAMKHSTTQARPDPACLVLIILDIHCIVLIKLRKSSRLRDRNSTNVEVLPHALELRLCEASYLLHRLAIDFMFLNVFVYQVNVILRLERHKPLKLCIRNLAF